MEKWFDPSVLGGGRGLRLYPGTAQLSMVMCIAIITFCHASLWGGANKWHLIGMCLLGVVAVGALIVLEPYRMERFTAVSYVCYARNE